MFEQVDQLIGIGDHPALALLPYPVHRIAVAVQGLAQPVTGTRDHQPAHERRFRVTADVPITEGVVDVFLALQIEQVHRPPFVGDVGAQHVTVRMGFDAVRLMGRCLGFTAVQQQRRSGHHATKADVGDVELAVKRHQAQPVGPGSPRAFRRVHHHAPGDAAGVETQLQQQRQKQLVEFIAIATAPLFEHFSFDRFKVDGHGLTQQRRQGFKREFGGMALLQLAQRVEGRRWGASKPRRRR